MQRALYAGGNSELSRLKAVHVGVRGTCDMKPWRSMLVDDFKYIAMEQPVQVLVACIVNFYLRCLRQYASQTHANRLPHRCVRGCVACAVQFLAQHAAGIGSAAPMHVSITM